LQIRKYMQENVRIQREAAERLPDLLSELLGAPVSTRGLRRPRAGADFSLKDETGRQWLFEVKSRSGPLPVKFAASQLRAAAGANDAVLVVVVPYMSPAGARIAEAEEVNWMDLSGNASIRADGLRILVRGAPNAYPAVGRPASPFAPRSARVTRVLLLDPERWWRQKELVAATSLDDSQVSRVVRRLRDEGLLHARDREVRPADAGHLLEAWADAYRFDRHDIVLGHLSGSGVELARRLSERLVAAGVSHAFTGLPAAWAIDHFASFRLVSVYVEHDPREAAAAVHLRREARGANVQLIGPDDAGVFAGTSEHDGFTCVSPAQVFVDLRHLPERALDASEHLRLRQSWGGDAP
jgi:hypothetical protein